MAQQIPVRPLKYLAQLRADKAPESQQSLPYLGLEQVEGQTGRIISYLEDEQPAEGNLFRPNDVLFGRLRPYLAKVALPDRLGKSTGEMLTLRPQQGTAPRFLHFSLLAKDFIDFADGSSQGTKMPRASWDFLGRHGRWAPPMEEQRRIASFLDRETKRIDGLVEAKAKLIELLIELQQTRLAQGVCRGVDPKRSSTRRSGVGWLGSIPSHWGVEKLSHVARIESGHTPSKSDERLWTDCTVPWLTTSDLHEFRDGRKEYVSDTTYKLSWLGIANSSARILPVGTVFLSRTASVGFSGVFAIRAATSQDFACWVCGPRVLPEYLLYVLRSMKPEFERLAAGSTHQTIYTSDSAAFKMPLPPIEEQKQIVASIRRSNAAIFEAIDAVRASIALLREKRQAIITTAVSGQVEISREVFA